MKDGARLAKLVDEATARFVGRGEIVGVAIGGDADITIFLSRADTAQEDAVRTWAKRRSISVSFVESGRFVQGLIF
jgi:hypothetical protein